MHPNHVIKPYATQTENNITFLFSVETTYTCLSGTLQLTCPGDKIITDISAFYGQWNDGCIEDDQCCDPTPNDCKEDMSQVAEHNADYQTIYNACNNQTSCAVQLYQTSLDSCNSPYIGEYALVNYTCFPGKGLG